MHCMQRTLSTRTHWYGDHIAYSVQGLQYSTRTVQVHAVNMIEITWKLYVVLAVVKLLMRDMHDSCHNGLIA